MNSVVRSIARIGALSLAAIAALTVARSAHAQGYTDSCGSADSICLEVETTGAGDSSVYAQSAGGTAVSGRDTSSGYGIYGNSDTGTGAYGESSSGDGVYGYTAADTGYGVYGLNAGSYGIAIYGNASGTDGIGLKGTGYLDGVYGSSSSGDGVYGASTSGYAVYAEGNAYVTGELYVGSCSGCSSDARLKKNIEPLQGAMDRLLQLKGVTFEWIDPSIHDHEAGQGQGTQMGFIAQDVEKVFPNMVKGDGYTGKDGTKYRTLELRQMEALEVESIRELRTQHNEDQTRIKKLEDRLDALQNGRDPVTGGIGVGRGTLLLAGLGMLGLFGVSRRKKAEKQA